MNHTVFPGAADAAPELIAAAFPKGQSTHRHAHTFRRITPGQQTRLEAAARAEDARSVKELLTAAIASPHTYRNAALPEAIRATVKAGYEAHARQVLESVTVMVPPRLEMLLALTLDTGMLIQEALELTFSNIDERTGKVTLSRDRGNGTRYQLPSEYLELLQKLKTFDLTRPVLRLSRTSLERSWVFMRQASGVPELTLRDLEFEAQSQLRMRQLA